ncbi:hypothetical protein IAT38_002802 [Cryptococcus sp. DSM 104549]
MAPKTAAPKKKSGTPSAYNVYMKVQLAKLKKEQEESGKKADHKENFKKVAASWKTAPENPVSDLLLASKLRAPQARPSAISTVPEDHS